MKQYSKKPKTRTIQGGKTMEEKLRKSGIDILGDALLNKGIIAMMNQDGKLIRGSYGR